ncbi:MAG: CBS domain-containing protein [Steroidobacteraceae bacterium]|nr:CBS domain-containing protein [Steroidobacteraceae bacterium]MDW8260501.1 CBS domain-containing protein [Gammaproteobacteria bacterium]
MRAGEFCQRNVVTIRPQEELQTAARLMREKHVGCLVVTQPLVEFGGERPIGIVTDRDIVTTVIARDVDPRSVTVGDIMTREPATVPDDATVEESLRRLRDTGVRRMPVVDKAGCLLGIVTLDDLLDHLVEQLSALAGSIRREQRVERSLRP